MKKIFIGLICGMLAFGTMPIQAKTGSVSRSSISRSSVSRSSVSKSSRASTPSVKSASKTPTASKSTASSSASSSAASSNKATAAAKNNVTAPKGISNIAEKSTQNTTTHTTNNYYTGSQSSSSKSFISGLLLGRLSGNRGSSTTVVNAGTPSYYGNSYNSFNLLKFIGNLLIFIVICVIIYLCWKRLKDQEKY